MKKKENGVVFAYNLYLHIGHGAHGTHLIWVDSADCSARGKFKFCFLELSVIFFFNIFNSSLVESTDVKPMDTEG